MSTRRASPFSTITATCLPRTSRKIGASGTSSRFGWRAITTSGAPCAPTASRSAIAPADAAPYEKFMAWARTVPYTLRNPLYHWTHLELKRYFGIDELLDEHTGPAIWEHAGRVAARADELTTHGILKKFRVTAVCTTDDPADDLAYHKAIAASSLRHACFPHSGPTRRSPSTSRELFNPGQTA